MKIVIRSKNSIGITLHVPFSFIKTKLFAKAILSSGDDEREVSKEKVELLQAQIKSAYRIMKEYVRENGHFNMVDIRDKDGDRIFVRM